MPPCYSVFVITLDHPLYVRTVMHIENTPVSIQSTPNAPLFAIFADLSNAFPNAKPQRIVVLCTFQELYLTSASIKIDYFMTVIFFLSNTSLPHRLRTAFPYVMRLVRRTIFFTIIISLLHIAFLV